VRTTALKAILQFVSLPLILVFAAVVTPALLQDKNPLAGSWNANIEKSKRHPNHLFKSAKLRFNVAADLVTLTYSGVNMSGVEETGTTTFHPDGKEHPIEGAPGVVEVSRWVDTRTLETIVTKDGKVIGQSIYAVSSDWKTLTANLKGVDASGAAFEQVIVWDRE